ncbi:helix-turn-helix transcriptional regulator [Kitasatospora sp. NPDC001664]|uniref:LuxR family transcriptional regulator n=1 Tax=Kitasatospora albolonga TaxID=68173 RepID=UPI0035E8B979
MRRYPIGADAALPELGPGALALYAWTVHNGRLQDADRAAALAGTGLAGAELTAALELLHAAGLLRRTEPDGCWRAVSPSAAGARLVAPQEDQLQQREEEVRAERARLRQLREYFADLMPAYLERRERSHPEVAVDVLEDQREVRAVLAETVRDCREEVLVSKPGGAFPPGTLREALPRDLALLERGVRMRSLYQDTTRYDPATRRHAAALIGAGAEIRTLPEVMPQLIVVDRRMAFLPNRSKGNGAVVVREPALLDHLLTVFDRDWAYATPFTSGPTAAQQTTGTLRRSILVLLAKGYKDETVARRLGFSLRTCRRHVSELLDHLGAGSRFQGGVIAERLGLTQQFDLPDEEPERPPAGRPPAERRLPADGV